MQKRPTLGVSNAETPLTLPETLLVAEYNPLCPKGACLKNLPDTPEMAPAGSGGEWSGTCTSATGPSSTNLNVVSPPFLQVGEGDTVVH